ncbi:jg6697 [Pararge aegeria aegeria]|uniref:Jg6697 protein n=1 Tax=Pararge aegeria aegeria TaxID=348720 RepID=A0A8S4SI81_9NEOP|nr:jg6697 [Pararge aegeria aegeria]
MAIYFFLTVYLLAVVCSEPYGERNIFESGEEHCDEERELENKRDKLYKDRVKFENQEEGWRPVFEHDDRIKPIQHKEKDDKFFLQDNKSPFYYPGIYTYPYYNWNGYYRPPFSYPEVNYFIKKETKDKPNFKV